MPWDDPVGLLLNRRAGPYDVRACVHRPRLPWLDQPGVDSMSKPSFAGRTLDLRVHPAQPPPPVAPAAAPGRPGQPDRAAHPAARGEPRRQQDARPEHPAPGRHARPVPAPERSLPHAGRLLQLPRGPRHGDGGHPVRPQRRPRPGLPGGVAGPDRAQPAHDQPHPDAARRRSRRRPRSTCWPRPGSSSRPTTGSPTAARPRTTSRSRCPRATRWHEDPMRMPRSLQDPPGPTRTRACRRPTSTG